LSDLSNSNVYLEQSNPSPHKKKAM
jgi:hypothetical protein